MFFLNNIFRSITMSAHFNKMFLIATISIVLAPNYIQSAQHACSHHKHDVAATIQDLLNEGRLDETLHITRMHLSTFGNNFNAKANFLQKLRSITQPYLRHLVAMAIDNREPAIKRNDAYTLFDFYLQHQLESCACACQEIKPSQCQSKGNFNELMAQEKCSLCHKTFRKKEMINPGNCNHLFCKDCLLNWAAGGHTFCHVCKTSIDTTKIQNQF